MVQDERSEQLSAVLQDMQIIEIACRSLSPQSLAQKASEFFFDFIDDQPSQEVLVDLSALPQRHAAALFDAFMTLSQDSGIRFGVASMDRLSDYEGTGIPTDLHPFRQFARHLLLDIAFEDVPKELRDFKFGADLGL
ncbi:hypothetical protein [Pseudomonas sp. p106]|uniref:hypothetical protein n=1 Tax=Pseudomonas sp. p106 TaxID=2479854 RepID=UPI000F7A3D1B|nr:hypothetical protein [Pseudomonas sp. p106]RRV45782.1 hypothetical protein EGJ09_12215 [Pseudomonas sp. p106]